MKPILWILMLVLFVFVVQSACALTCDEWDEYTGKCFVVE